MEEEKNKISDFSGYIVWDKENKAIKSAIIHSEPETPQRQADKLNMQLKEIQYIVRYIELH